MQYFSYLDDKIKDSLFFLKPGFFARDCKKEFMSHALGAALYMPATRENIAEDIISRKHKCLLSSIFCLEDSIGDNELEKAENMLVMNLNKLYDQIHENGDNFYNEIPYLFIRVRNPGQISRLADLAGPSFSILTGVVFPKFSFSNGPDYFQELEKVSKLFGKNFYGMPILETRDIIYWESRKKTLKRLNLIFNDFHDMILNIRIGGTDFSSIFGLRRGSDLTIYDIHVIRDCITDIINNFCRTDKKYVVSGPVWEYFSKAGAISFDMNDPSLTGLIKETCLDKANGLMGKTIIHPSHILPVQSLYAVNYEEYTDAAGILEDNHDTGVVKSSFANKMNEIKPHAAWAKKIMLRSKIYGVLNENKSFADLLCKACETG